MDYGPQQIEFEGVVEVTTFRNTDTGFGILKVRVDRRAYPHVPRDAYGRTPIVGELAMVEEGQKLVVVGLVKNHPKFGPQVEVDHFIPKEPKGLTEIQAFLASKTFGIGPYFANRIVKKFGEDTLRVMDEDPDRLVEVKGISVKRVENIKRMWSENRHLKEILRFCATVGISPKLAVQMASHKRYGPRTEERVRKDPYALARDIKGVGFRTADEIAKRLGVQEISALRIRAAAYHLIEEDMVNHGDCFVYHRDLVSKTVEFLAHPVIDQAMVEETLQEAYTLEILVNDGGRVYTPSMYRFESWSADLLRELIAHPKPSGLQDPQVIEHALEAARRESGVPLDDSQMEAVRMALTSKVSVLTGGPGVGKTSITKAIVAGLQDAHIPLTLMAPTGRAAKRMSEVIQHQASTIHRILYAFKKAIERGEAEPEDLQIHGCIIVDEFSMVDIRLFYDLLRFIHPSATLVLIGDADQLPSVGPGSVLRDLLDIHTIASKRLTKIYRQAESSDIITSAHAINRGQMPMLNILSRNHNLPDTDFYAVIKEDPQELAHCVIYCATTFAEYLGFDPRQDVQVITPSHRGAVGVQVLNAELQRLLNPSPEQSIQRNEEVWGVGDKLMNMKNDYDLNLMNGDIGWITSFDLGEGGKATRMWIQCDEGEVEVPSEKFGHFKLSYATTVHKSQGSEFPFVVMVLHTSHYTLLQRNLLYTGITRSRTKVTLCCHPKALTRAIANNRVAKRNSYLTARLNQLFEVAQQGAA